MANIPRRLMQRILKIRNLKLKKAFTSTRGVCGNKIFPEVQNFTFDQASDRVQSGNNVLSNFEALLKIEIRILWSQGNRKWIQTQTEISDIQGSESSGNCFPKEISKIPWISSSDGSDHPNVLVYLGAVQPKRIHQTTQGGNGDTGHFSERLCGLKNI